MFIKVKAHPKAGKEEVNRRGEDSYEIWTKAPAENGLANIAVLNALAKELGVQAKRLRIVKGSKAPSKIIELR